jgi:hypothetical protein
MSPRPSLSKLGAVLEAIKTKRLRRGLPARLDSPRAQRLSVSVWPGRGKALPDRTRKWTKDMSKPT